MIPGILLILIEKIKWTKMKLMVKCPSKTLLEFWATSLSKMLLLFIIPLDIFFFELTTFFSISSRHNIMISNATEISSISDDKENRITIPICTIADVNGKEHHLVGDPLKTQSDRKNVPKPELAKSAIQRAFSI